MADKKKKQGHFYDFSLLFAVLFITGFGLIMMYSASGYSAQSQMNDAMYYLKRQAVFAVLGIGVMLLVSRFFDYHLLGKFNLIIYVIAAVLVVLTMAIGLSSHGSSRWISLAGVRFQPSEIIKIAVIIVESSVITHYGYRINDWHTAVPVMAWGIIPGAVIAFNNLSTGMIIAGITFGMIFVACQKYWPFATLGLFGILAYVFAYPFARFLENIHVLHAYQLTRIFSWKDPASYADETFQTLQGLYAIGSGGIFGKGLGESVQKFLMPEAQNDMIFTIICEELGLFGAVSLILIYSFIIYRMYDIARNAKDLFGSMLVIGIMFHIALQAILNIAVATNSIPNTGITLPFVSYGGTSLVLLMSEVGICLSVSRQIVIERQ